MADNTVRVKAHPSMGARVALWEVDEAHPGGEIYVAGQDSAPVEAAETAGVLGALRDDRLVRVTAKSGGKPE
jgi:phage-related protein